MEDGLYWILGNKQTNKQWSVWNYFNKVSWFQSLSKNQMTKYNIILPINTKQEPDLRVSTSTVNSKGL